jgi:cytosine permease
MASNLPDYVASAQPGPLEGRVPWFKSTAQTYAGIMLWFVFWDSVPGSGATSPGGILAHGLGTAFIAVVVAAFLCHFTSYLAPGLMGMKTGLPLAVVGTSTYGVVGGFLMPGFFMGILQFGWLAVNAYFSAMLLAGLAGGAEGSVMHLAIGVVWAVVAAFVGLKGIHYVAKVATFLPLIPLVILLILAAKTVSGVGSFDPAQLGVVATELNVSSLDLMFLGIANIVGFFATAGAAGADIASSNRNDRDVHLGGLVGIAGATIFTGCLALLIVAGTYGSGLMEGKEVTVTPTALMEAIMGEGVAKIFWLLLAIAAFPPACFSSLIAAASFKNTLPKVNPFISVGFGTACSIILVLTGTAGQAAAVFGFIGASFGPICGAMTADYLLSGCKWPGPRAGFNPAGWISWAVGFIVGVWPVLAPKLNIGFQIPCAPVAAIIVGFVLYFILAKIGLTSATLEMPSAAEETKPAEA